MRNLNKPLPSFCTSNFEVLNFLMIYSKIHKLPVLIECTSNQVNQYGGYTKLKPINFYKKIMNLKNKFKLKKENVLIGADHLGPLPWKHLDEKKALKNAIKLFKDCINAKFNKIHIDTGIKLKKDSSLSKKIIIERCKKIYNSVNKKKLNHIKFVFGTEVPVAGGGGGNKMLLTSLKAIKKDIEEYKKIRKRFSLVVEPGLNFTNNKVYKLNMKNFKQKYILSKKDKFSFEAHSTDFQQYKSLKKLVKNNFLYLKIGPELTFNFMKAVLYMQSLEKKFFNGRKSNIQNNISSIMDKKKIYWKNYYKGKKKVIENLKFNSFLDRSRYYWNEKKIIQSLSILKKNINKLKNKDIFINKKISKNSLLKINRIKFSNYDIIVYSFLEKIFKKYYKACGYKI